MTYAGYTVTHGHSRNKIPLGQLDPYSDLPLWDSETARYWVAALEERSKSPDQIRLRETLLQRAELSPGATAVEIGCGPGALLHDLARCVGPEGKVFGIEPQHTFAATARSRMSEAGLSNWEVLEVAGDHTMLPDGGADACIEHTVLIHLAECQARNTVREMLRIAKPGARVICADHDADTWTIDHPDRDITRRVIQFNSDQRFADGWRGRQLRRMLSEAGAEDVNVEPYVHKDCEPDSYLFKLATRISDAALSAQFITAEEHAHWAAGLSALAESGHFFSTINFNICTGAKPRRNT